MNNLLRMGIIIGQCFFMSSCFFGASGAYNESVIIAKSVEEDDNTKKKYKAF